MVAVISGIVCGETPRPSGARAAFKDAGQAERHLLAALGMKRRPVVDKSKVEIPAAMMELYRMQMSNEFDTAGLPLPGRHVKTANTARTYLHRGEYDLRNYYELCLDNCQNNGRRLNVFFGRLSGHENSFSAPFNALSRVRDKFY